MSRTPNGRMRKKVVREAFTEQSPYHKNAKRRSLQHSFDDTDIAYRSAPEYLRQLMNTSINSTRSLTRTYSASEITPRTLGNPKYKAQEDYYDEVHALKKELKSSKDDNINLRGRIRRLEEDNARKAKEIDGLYDTNRDGDTRRGSISSSIPNTSVVMNLKQRLFKLETQLKQKETIIDEMKNDPRWTKGTELEIQNRALFNEIEKQKVERLNFIQNDYLATVDEEKKNAVRKLEGEKSELKIENENLKKKLSDRSEQLSTRQREESIERKIHDLKDKCRAYENEIEQMKDDFKDMRRDRDKYKDKFETMKEGFEDVKRQRTGRSSPTSKHYDERQTTRPLSGEPWKKDHMNPRKPLEDSHSPLTTKASSQNIRQKHSASDDFFDQDIHGGTVSPRASQQKLGSKADHLGSGTIKNKEPAFKTVQAALRGYLNRNGVDKTSRPRNISDDEDSISAHSRKHESERKREDHPHHSGSHRTPSPPEDRYRAASPRTGSKQNLLDQYKPGSKSRLPNDNRESRRTPSPPDDKHRPSSPRSGSKQNLLTDQYKLGSKSRLPNDNRESRRTPSPPDDKHRPLSPRTGSKQNLQTDQYKLGSMSQLPNNDREPYRTHSPAIDDHRSSSPRSNSKQNLFDQYKLGSKSRLPNDNRESRRTPSPPDDKHRPLSPRTGSKQNLQTDQYKLGSKSRLPNDDRATRRTPSPPDDKHRPSSPRTGSKQNLLDQYKLGSKSRLPNDNRESRRTPSPPDDKHRPSSPRTGSKQNLQTDQYKFGSKIRLPDDDRELHRLPTSSPRDIGSRQFLSNERNKHGSTNGFDRDLSSRKAPSNSKPSLKDRSHNDDDDVEGF